MCRSPRYEVKADREEKGVEGMEGGRKGKGSYATH